MVLSKGDMSCAKAARAFARKSDHYPYTDRYITEVHDSPDKTGRTEREHMVAWFADNATKGRGSYARETPNESAKRCYNRLMNAASLLWIAEAAGIDEVLVEKAFDAAVEAGDYRRACAAIRNVISWDMVCEKL